LDNTLLSSLTASISNYWSGTNNNIDGRYVPTFVRVQGFIDINALPNVRKIAVFFNNLEPFYKNIFTNEINCASTDKEVEVSCVGMDNSNANGNIIENMQYLNRVEIEVKIISFFF
jgi:hypothetical protein